MFILTFVASVVVYAFLDRQERRHKIELQIEYEKLGKMLPEESPKLPMLESIMNIVTGVILCEIGIISLLAYLVIVREAGSIMSRSISYPQLDFGAAFLAGGIALTILGVKGVRANVKFRITGSAK